MRAPKPSFATSSFCFGVKTAFSAFVNNFDAVGDDRGGDVPRDFENESRLRTTLAPLELE